MAEIWSTRPREMRWQVGVLRNGEENIVWVSEAVAPDWASARAATIAAVHELVAVEGRQEYRLRIDDVEGILNPGVDADGNIVVGDLEQLIPVAH